jgi:hypothetical protein
LPSAAALNLPRRLACAAASRCAACCRERPVQPLRQLSEKSSPRNRVFRVVGLPNRPKLPAPATPFRDPKDKNGCHRPSCCGAYSTSTSMVCRRAG